MIIRAFKPEDYEKVHALLAASDVEPPAEPSDLDGICLVAEDEGKVVACLWALVGTSTQAYIGYGAVHPDYRKTHIGWQLVQFIDRILKDMGVKRYTFYVEAKNKEFRYILDNYQGPLKAKRLTDMIFYWREIT